MQNEKLIPILLKYVKVNKVIFPIQRVKNLSNDELIDVLNNCIDKQIIYNLNYEKVKNSTLLDDNTLKEILPLIKMSMDSINYDYMKDINTLVNGVKSRKKGKKYAFEDHLKALILSLLANHRWTDNNIKNNIDTIDKIFHNYDRNYLKIIDPNVLVNKLKDIHCTNANINKQMQALSKNIMVLESIEKDYGSLDNFVNNKTPNDIANTFNNGKYKLIQVGRAITYDYLKKVGINTCKKSIEIQRLFGKGRLGIVDNNNATEQQVLNIIKRIAELNNCDEIVVEAIIEQFCLSSATNICSEIPNCNKCKLRHYCNS